MKHIDIEYKMHKKHVYSLGETRFGFMHSVFLVDLVRIYLKNKKKTNAGF